MPTLKEKQKAMAYARAYKKGINRSRGPKNPKDLKKLAYHRGVNRTRPSYAEMERRGAPYGYTRTGKPRKLPLGAYAKKKVTVKKLTTVRPVRSVSFTTGAPKKATSKRAPKKAAPKRARKAKVTKMYAGYMMGPGGAMTAKEEAEYRARVGRVTKTAPYGFTPKGRPRKAPLLPRRAKIAGRPGRSRVREREVATLGVAPARATVRRPATVREREVATLGVAPVRATVGPPVTVREREVATLGVAPVRATVGPPIMVPAKRDEKDLWKQVYRTSSPAEQMELEKKGLKPEPGAPFGRSKSGAKRIRPTNAQKQQMQIMAAYGYGY